MKEGKNWGFFGDVPKEFRQFFEEMEANGDDPGAFISEMAHAAGAHGDDVCQECGVDLSGFSEALKNQLRMMN